MLNPQVHDVSMASPVSAEIEATERLQHPDVNLVSWHRELYTGLGAELEEWAQWSPAYFRETIALPHYTLAGATSGLSDPARRWLTMDIAGLIARLADLSDARRLRVFFGAMRTNQCRKFHTDYVRYRLITTYVGPGTEWVPDHAVDRAELKQPASCPLDANERIVRDTAAVRHAAPGEVLLMKGALHPNHRGAVHRSPPIEGTGRVRVVLVASTVDASLRH